VFSIPFFYLGALLWDSRVFLALNAEVLGAVLFQGLIATAVAFVVWTRLMRSYGTVALHSFVYLIPVAGVFLAGIWLGEPATGTVLLALALIVGGIFVVQFGERRATPSIISRSGG
jgi:drug/metabolite transporter (DMT)-like permease